MSEKKPEPAIGLENGAPPRTAAPGAFVTSRPRPAFDGDFAAMDAYFPDLDREPVTSEPDEDDAAGDPNDPVLHPADDPSLPSALRAAFAEQRARPMRRVDPARTRAFFAELEERYGPDAGDSDDPVLHPEADLTLPHELRKAFAEQRARPVPRATSAEGVRAFVEANLKKPAASQATGPGDAAPPAPLPPAAEAPESRPAERGAPGGNATRPKESPPGAVLSIRRFFNANPWAVPILAAAALLVIYLVATRANDQSTANSWRSDPHPREPLPHYHCGTLPPSKLPEAERLGTISPEEREHLTASRDRMGLDTAQAVDALEADQKRFGLGQRGKLLWQEREALIIHGLQCTGQPFRERAEDFLKASPGSAFAESVKKDLETAR